MAQQQEIKPAYEVHPFSGVTTRRMYEFDEEKRIIIPKDVEAKGGYMVYFPKGHSIRAFDDAHLAELGFDKPAKLIDMETGEETGEAHGSLKTRSERMTRITSPVRTRKRRLQHDCESSRLPTTEDQSVRS